MAAEQTPSHWRWRAAPADPGPAVIFDIDGVLSDATGRQHFLVADPGGRKNWRGFFDAVGDDALLEDVAALLEVIDRDVVVVLLTGRPVRVQPQTFAWLERFGLRWDLLVMRNAGNYQHSPEFKRLTVKELRERGFDIKVAFEDDHRNIEMFRSEGVPCVYIHSGYYD
ncbi:MAG TPA: HAD family acid phosphatase [Acidimicrobiales bacterium]|nr:HAD family acid phosphatase [Acidimicrobiales bacterium]